METSDHPPPLFGGYMGQVGGVPMAQVAQNNFNMRMTRILNVAAASEMPPLYHWLGAEADRVGVCGFMANAMQNFDEYLSDRI